MNDKPYNIFGMTDREYEEVITRSCAETSKFDKKENYYVCRLCGIRFNINYIGKPINERMLDHFGLHLKNNR